MVQASQSSSSEVMVYLCQNKSQTRQSHRLLTNRWEDVTPQDMATTSAAMQHMSDLVLRHRSFKRNTPTLYSMAKTTF
jgi:hypothetical protein